MLTATRRRPGRPALLAIGLLFFLPAMAEAQLFPNLPIRRQRESCASEPPFYGQVRRDYFGYYPTCWSKFPEGWACPCPNPELPNAAAEFQKRPRDAAPDPNAGEPGLGNEPDDGMAPGDPPAADPALPPVPNRGRSPFELDNKPDPFETPAPNPNAPKTPKPGGSAAAPRAGRANPPASLPEMPSLPEISPTTGRNESTLEPGSMAMVPDATLASNRAQARPDLGPLPSAPATNPGMMADPEPMIGVPPAAPAQAPQRRSLLGGLFGSGNRRRR